MPSENYKISKDSPIQTVQKQKIYVKRKPFKKLIWKRKEPNSSAAVTDLQKKLVLVEVTYKDAQGKPRTSCLGLHTLTNNLIGAGIANEARQRMIY